MFIVATRGEHFMLFDHGIRVHAGNMCGYRTEVQKRVLYTTTKFL